MSAKVQINYVSGHKEVMDVEEFTVTVKNSGREINWKLADNAKLKPLLLNVDAIESIWEIL